MPGFKPLRGRFDSKYSIDKAGCWIWTASRHNTGYGAIGVAGNKVSTAHRVSWMLHRGPIPDGMWVLHKCDVRACVNPDHLYLGTVKDNARDLRERGNPYVPSFPWHDAEAAARRNAKLPRGAAHHRSAAKLNEKQVRDIYLSDGSQSAIASRFGVCQQTVSDIKRRDTWGHINADS